MNIAVMNGIFVKWMKMLWTARRRGREHKERFNEINGIIV